MKSQNSLRSSSYGMQQQGSQMKESTNSNNTIEQITASLQKQNSQQQQESFQFDSQQLVTFQNRTAQKSLDQQQNYLNYSQQSNFQFIHQRKVLHSRHLRNISQPVQQVNLPLTSNDSSFINHENSMEEQQFNYCSQQKTNRSLEEKNANEQSNGNISPLLKGEKLFNDYMKDLSNYKETYAQYNHFNRNTNSSLSQSSIQKKQLIEQQLQQINTLQQQFQQNEMNKPHENIYKINSSPPRFPKILFVHSQQAEKTPPARPRTLTPPIRSPSQSNTAQKPNLTILTQQSSHNKNNSFTAGVNRSFTLNQSPSGGIAKVSSSLITNTPYQENQTPPTGTSPKVGITSIQKPVLQNNNSQVSSGNNKGQNQLESVSNLTRMVNSITSSSVSKIINKTQNVCVDQKSVEYDNSAISSNYQTNKSNVNNNVASNYTTNQNNQSENINNNSKFISHSNNGKIMNIKQSQNQQSSSLNKSQNEYNYQSRMHTAPSEIKSENNKSSNIYTTPMKSSNIQKQGGERGYLYNSHSKSSPNQQFLSSAVTTTAGGNGCYNKQNHNLNGSFLHSEQNAKLDQYAKADLNQLDYYKQKIEELANIIKDKDSYINEFENIKNQFFLLKKQMEEKDTDIIEQKSKLNQQVQIFQELEIEHNNMMNLSNIQRKQIEEQQEIISQLRKQIQFSKNESVSFNLENQNNSHLAEVNTLKQSIQNKEEILQTLREKTNQSKTQIEDLQGELSKLKQENNSLNSQLKQNIQENNELQLMIEEFQTQIATQKNEMKESAKKQLNSSHHEQIIQKQREDINSLKQQVDEKSRQLSHTLQELQQLLKENTIITEKYNEVTSQLIDRSSELKHLEATHRRELEQIQQSIKNECAQEIMNEMENITQPLLQENKFLQEEITKEKQKIEVLMQERGQYQMYEMLARINEHKDNTQKLQSLLDQRINNFILGQDDVTKQLIEQLRNENRELRRNCDIWKAKYKKIQREMLEVNEQFEEYSKVMTAMKSLQSKMHDMTSSLCCSQSHPSVQHTTTLPKKDKSNNSSTTNNNISNGNNSSNGIISNNSNQWSLQTQQQQRINYSSSSYTPTGEEQADSKINRDYVQFLQNDAQHLEPDAANSLLDTLEGYDLFEQQLKEEIIQDINRIQHNFSSVQSQIKSSQQQQQQSITTTIPSEYKQTGRSIDICISNYNPNSQNSQIQIQQNNESSTSHSPHFQQNPVLSIQVEKNYKNSSQPAGKPPQYNKDLINQNQKYQPQQISNQYNSASKLPLSSYNTPSMKKTSNEQDLNEYDDNIHRQNIHNQEDNKDNFNYINETQKNSPELSKNQQESCYLSQEANVSYQQDSSMGNTNHNNGPNIQHQFSNQANCSISTQQLSAERLNKRIKSIENRELRLLCQSDEEKDSIEEDIQENIQQKALNQKLQQIQTYNHDNNFIEEERDQDVDYSDSSVTNQSDRNGEQNLINQKISKPFTPQFLQANTNLYQKVGITRNKRNTDEFSFKNPSCTEPEEAADQLSSGVSLSVYQKDMDQKMEKLNQQNGFDSDNQAHQKNESINLTKNSCVSSLNNMVCIESIQLDQDNVEILKQMKDLDKKILKEKTTYEKYLQKCSNFSTEIDHEKSIDQQTAYPYQQSNELKNSAYKTSEELTAMLTAFDAQFENLQKEKQKILTNFKNKEIQRKIPTPPRVQNQQQDNEIEINAKIEQKLQSREQLNLTKTPPPPPSQSQKMKYTFNNNETNNESSGCSENTNEIEELRKRYQQTIQNILGGERGGTIQKQKQLSNLTTTTNLTTTSSTIPTYILSESSQLINQYKKTD